MLMELDDYNWEEAFGEGCQYNTRQWQPEKCPPGADISDETFSRADVSQIIAMVDGCNDGDDWVGIFLLNDGRYACVEAGCDYTGWDCQAYNSLRVSSTLEDAFRFGVGDYNRGRLMSQLEQTNKALWVKLMILEF